MVNDKAFVIGDSPITRENWQNAKLKSGKILSWHKDLHVVLSPNGRIALLGDCWQAKGSSVPQQDILSMEQLSAAQILEEEKYWCGRYVLIVDNMVYMDTAGLMSVFYTDGYISNSLNVLREIKKLPLKKEKIRRGTMPDFVLGPYTRYEGIYRQLPSFVLDYTRLECSFRELLPDGVIAAADDRARTELFVDVFSNSLKNLFAYFSDKRIMIAVTGGRDSRAALGVLEKTGLDYDICILEHGNISKEDISISRKLSNALNKKHYFIPRTNSLSKEKLKKFDEHTCNYVVDQDRLFYGYGQYEQLKTQAGKDIVVLRGSVWGCVNEIYKLTDLKEAETFYPLLKYNNQYRNSVKKWINEVSLDQNNKSLCPADRFFWEMREGCWLSSIEQAFDLTEGVTSIQPLNCRYLLSILLGYQLDLRKNKKHEEMIANTACPAIKDVPYDYQIAEKTYRSAYRNLSEKSKKMIWITRNYGLNNMLDFLRTKVK